MTNIDYETEVIQEPGQGPPGPRGVDGNTVLYGSNGPTQSDGVIGNFWINTSTNYIFGPKTVNGWPTGVSIVGPRGFTGMQGPAGADGNTVLYGTGVPNDQTVGKPGNFYIDTAAHYLYGPKGATTWPAGISLVGPPSGRTLGTAARAPTSADGIDGDFWINTAVWLIYGPKAGGAWPAGVSIIGPQGPQGPAGAAATDWNNVTNKPTTLAGYGITDALLKPNATANITAGYTFTTFTQENFSGTFNPDPTKGNYQGLRNAGAITINPPTVDCAIDILIANGSSPGAITFAGSWSVSPGNTGDLLDTVAGHMFILSIRRLWGSVATYMIKALQ